MGTLIHILISLAVVYCWFTVAYLWGRKDEEGNRVYEKDQAVYSLATLLIVYFVVNLPKIITLFS